MSFEALDALLERMPSMGLPAADLSVTKDHEVIYRKIVGHADTEKQVALTDKHIFWCFSTTKVITCVMAMRLVGEGKLDLDAPVSDYLPEYADAFVIRPDHSISRAQNVMKVRHLFSMSAGLTYKKNAQPIQELLSQNPSASTREIVSRFIRSPLEFEPGTNYRYSLAHDVLAAVCEVVSGMRFSDYLQKYLLDPLGMTDTGFRPNEEQKSRFMATHQYQNGLGTSVPMETKNEFCLSDNYDSGGAGLFSTVSDYTKFVSSVACGGVSADGYQLLNPDVIPLMQKNELTDAGRMAFAVTRLYGYGWGLCGRVHMNPNVSFSRSPVGEFGWDGAAAGFAMIDPKNRIGLYFGTQTRGCTFAYNILHPMMRNLVYEGLGL